MNKYSNLKKKKLSGQLYRVSLIPNRIVSLSKLSGSIFRICFVLIMMFYCYYTVIKHIQLICQLSNYISSFIFLSNKHSPVKLQSSHSMLSSYLLFLYVG